MTGPTSLIRHFAAAFILAAACFPASALADGISDCKNIQTDKGKVSGALNSTTPQLCVYKGIPFAAPPVGNLRFAPPVEHAPWTDTLNATKPGNECLQFPLGMVASGEPIGNEDCLYLNIWHPVSASKGLKPVMVFIHGGGFVMGSGTQAWYKGDTLASKGDVVLVTINYRLGPFGFMAHPALRDSAGHAGNYGFLDQVSALVWVKNNIKNFGGNPDNVTIFGESAGSMSVSLHLVSPLSKGLFKKAIAQSGPAALIRASQAQVEEKGIAQAAELGCEKDTDADACLRAVDAVTIMKVLKPVMATASGDEAPDRVSNRPCVDGYAVPEDPHTMLKNGAAKGLAVMLGSNKNEMALFTTNKQIKTREKMEQTIRKDARAFLDSFDTDVFPEGLLNLYDEQSCGKPKQCYNDILSDAIFTCPNVAMANALAGGSDTYLYYFTQTYSDIGFTRGMGAFHSAELFFLFNTLTTMAPADTPDNKKVSDMMISLWSSFAHTGNPAAPGAPAWPKYNAGNAAYFDINLTPAIGNYLKKPQCDFINKWLLGE